MTENYPNPAGKESFVAVSWFEVQLEGALSLLGADRSEVNFYGARSVFPGEPDSPLILNVSFRNGRRYQFYNFKEFIQVVEVTTEEQMKQNEAMLKLLFGG